MACEMTVFCGSIYNKAAKGATPPPPLTTTLPNREVKVMAINQLSQNLRKKQEVCSVDGCSNGVRARLNGVPYCDRHRMHIRLYGKILKRTLFDPNTFVIDENDCKIWLFNKHKRHTATAIIDKDDYPLVKDYKWSLTGRYACTREFGKKKYLHRLILATADEVDHIDGDCLNNRRTNLRVCSHIKNSYNQKIRCGGSSAYKGVSFNKEKNKWEAYICANHNRYRLGYFKKETDAASAYNKRAIELHGEFARLNPITLEALEYGFVDEVK